MLMKKLHFIQYVNVSNKQNSENTMRFPSTLLNENKIENFLKLSGNLQCLNKNKNKFRLKLLFEPEFKVGFCSAQVGR